MSVQSRVLIAVFTVALLLAAPIIFGSTVHAGKLEDAIAATPEGGEKGQINPEAEKATSTSRGVRRSTSYTVFSGPYGWGGYFRPWAPLEE